MSSSKGIRVLVSSGLLLLSLPFLVGGIFQYRATRLWGWAREACFLNQEQEALRRYGKAYPTLFWNDWFLGDYAACLRRADELDRAVEILEVLTRRRPNPYALEELGEVYARRGSMLQAIEAARMASEILPWRLTAKWQLASYYRLDGDTKEARASARDLLLTPVKVLTPESLRLKEKARGLLADLPGPALIGHPEWQEALNLGDEQWRTRLCLSFEIAGENAAELIRAIVSVDPPARDDLCFLIVNMPESDLIDMTASFLLADLESARASRDIFPFLEPVPGDVVRRYVIPYSQLDERREDWRTRLRRVFAPEVAGALSTREAVEIVRKGLLPRLGLEFSTNPLETSVQNPSESIEQGRVDSLSGSILLADVLRSLGIPSRVVVSFPLPSDEDHFQGWVDVFVNGEWNLVAVAAGVEPVRAGNGVYAASFERTDLQIADFGPSVWWHKIPSRSEPSAQGD